MYSVDIKMTLARLAKVMSSLGGLDSCLMLAQFSSPFIIALLLRLARLRASLARHVGVDKVGSEAQLYKRVEGITKAAGGISEARVIMRAFGLLPVILGLAKLHPKPIQSLQGITGALSSPKAIPTVQALSLAGYYSMEQLAWLGGKGVLDIAPLKIKQMSLWSVRCWAVYVFLELFKLNQTYSALRTRTRAIRSAKPKVSAKEAEGYEIPSVESTTVTEEKKPGVKNDNKQLDKEQLRKDWDTWRLSTLTNW
ncbi:hypothetical protein BD324DRAFT_620587 [Kockovaella imperatae]|uniref:Uncharacterized protein n=1 Tax=Kockovaella imperatae TaxID=4999 RepID=A0A1Y1ULE6_9TREE|nr:hypothetical protein BD324DRAFT_620587 [Kockovaella imperatae]ORX38367.1 hypothetical protein BD324DRAFT_620587 [Kockovaella imperatae]